MSPSWYGALWGLAEGRAVGSKELREYNEVKGYADAADWVYQQATGPGDYAEGLLTKTELRRIHAMALTPVTWPQVPAEIDAWVRDVRKLKPFPGTNWASERKIGSIAEGPSLFVFWTMPFTS